MGTMKYSYAGGVEGGTKTFSSEELLKNNLCNAPQVMHMYLSITSKN